MDNADTTERFVQQLAEHQNRLYGYVYSLLGDHSRAADVVQETNLVLWRKIDEFQSEMPFLPWAFAIARFQVLAHLRDRKRDRVLLDADLVEKLSDETGRQAKHFESLRDALRTCLQSIAPGSRNLIERRYYRAMSLPDVAQSVDRSVGSVKVALLRIRRQLAACVQKQIAAEH